MDMGTQSQEVTDKTEVKNIQTRRVGSVTFGLTLISFGVMFLIHIVVPAFRYDIIFRLWPIVFVLLGIEILVENHKSNQAECRFVYDFAAVLMLVLMLLFAMILAAVDYAMMYGAFVGSSSVHIS